MFRFRKPKDLEAPPEVKEEAPPPPPEAEGSGAVTLECCKGLPKPPKVSKIMAQLLHKAGVLHTGSRLSV